jgi:hypothetical protein
MTYARKPRRSAKSQSRRGGPNASASGRQIGYIKGLRPAYDPLSVGSPLPTTRAEASVEIERLLSIKAKLETSARMESRGNPEPKGSGQYRYPTAP